MTIVTVGFNTAKILMPNARRPGRYVVAGTRIIGLHFNDLPDRDRANGFLCFQQWPGAGASTCIGNFGCDYLCEVFTHN